MRTKKECLTKYHTATLTVLAMYSSTNIVITVQLKLKYEESIFCIMGEGRSMRIESHNIPVFLARTFLPDLTALSLLFPTVLPSLYEKETLHM